MTRRRLAAGVTALAGCAWLGLLWLPTGTATPRASSGAVPLLPAGAADWAVLSGLVLAVSLAISTAWQDPRWRRLAFMGSMLVVVGMCLGGFRTLGASGSASDAQFLLLGLVLFLASADRFLTSNVVTTTLFGSVLAAPTVLLAAGLLLHTIGNGRYLD